MPHARNAPDQVLRWLGGLALALAACGGEPAPPVEPPGPGTAGAAGGDPVPDAIVVLVTLDTLRADHLSWHGYPRETAPFLASLAERGVSFTAAHAPISHTAPSHATMFTGLLPVQHHVQVNGQTLDPELPSLAGLLGAAGLRTGAFTSTGFLRLVATGFQQVDKGLRVGAQTVDAALAWVQGLPADASVFLWVHLFDVHEWGQGDYPPTGLFLERMRQDHPGGDESWYADLAARHGWPHADPAEPFEPFFWDSEGKVPVRSRRQLLAAVDRYDALIRYADQQVERLHRAVTDRWQGRRILWLVAGDHGEGLGSHRYRGHGGQLFQEQLRVPLLVVPTGAPPTPRRVDGLVSLADLFPTVAEALGLPAPDCEGISLWPQVLGGPAPQAERLLLAQRKNAAGDEQTFALVAPTWKYIHHPSRPAQLFDLEQDPLELVNLRQRERRERARSLLERRLAELRSRTLATGAVSAEVPADVQEELRALGYVK